MRIKALILTTLISSLGFVSLVYATQLVVISSDTKQFTPGAIIEASREITLPADASITLISSDGSTIKMNGPFKGKPYPGPAVQNKSLIEALSEIAARKSTAELAVFRGIMVSQRDLWAINVNALDTPYCVRGDKNVIFWSDLTSGNTSLQITPHANLSNTVSVNWPRSEHVVDWPASVPLVDRARYSLTLEDSGNERQVEIRIMPADLNTDAHRAAWMWEQGCDNQAGQLVRALAAGE